jgi:hypothetical protein
MLRICVRIVGKLKGEKNGSMFMLAWSNVSHVQVEQDKYEEQSVARVNGSLLVWGAFICGLCVVESKQEFCWPNACNLGLLLYCLESWTMGVLGKTRREVFSQHHQSIISWDFVIGVLLQPQ